ncbi:MAG: hypothetical protein FWE81_03470 [Rikenellaceae bacterium]|nr:hypothetical protein [Rikenellaceae bacterium]
MNGRAITHLVLYEVVTHYDGDEAARVELQEPVILDKSALAESTIAWSVYNGELGARWRELGYEFSVTIRKVRMLPLSCTLRGTRGFGKSRRNPYICITNKFYDHAKI